MAEDILRDTDLTFGLHNETIEKTKTRLIEGYSWKRNDIVMVIPAAKLVPARAALSWMGLIFPPNNGVARWCVLGREIGEAYSGAFEQIVTDPNLGKFQYILTVEHDNIPPPIGVLELIKLMNNYPQFSAISGLYFTKGEMGQPQIWGDIRDPVRNYRPQIPDLELQVQECYGIGMGFALWRMEMFKDPLLEKPWFKTCAGMDGVGTQDLYFWNKAGARGYRCGVAPGVRVGHLDFNTDIVW
jgi:hypothetical protein